MKQDLSCPPMRSYPTASPSPSTATRR